MPSKIVLPLVFVGLMSLSFCKKEAPPIVFTVTNNLTGEPLPNATIKWFNVDPPYSLTTWLGLTDNKGHLSWDQAFDTLPAPKTNFFTCESPGFYVETFHFNDPGQKTFDVKMRQNAVVKFNLQYQNSTTPKSFFIYQQYIDSLPLGGAYPVSLLIFHTYNKTELDEVLEKPVPDIANIKYLCFKLDSVDIGNPLPAPNQSFQISGRPQQPVYSFDVTW